MKKENWNIIAKHLSDETLSKEELTYIDDAHANEEMKKIVDESVSTLNKVDRFYKLKNINTDKAWNKIDRKISKPGKTITLAKRILQIAAIFLLVIATSVLTRKIIITNNYNEFKTSQADISRPQITLPDGTIVTLNHGSEIKYPKKFKGNKRVITLQGEAFFDVTPNKEMPFIIETQNASVRVLGTSFNVYAYNNKNTIEVTVETGKVELINEITETAAAEKVLLLPGDKGTYNKTTGEIQKLSIEKSNSLSWITHEIEFELTELKEVFSTLEHIYSLSIDLDTKVDPNQIITASFNKQDPDYIMDVVALTLSLDIRNTGNNAYFVKNK